MTYKLASLLAFCIYSISLTAQKGPAVPNSGRTIANGVALYDEGNFQAALDSFSSIHPSDSNYLLALYEKSLTEIALEQYDSAVATCKKAISQGTTEPMIYNTYGTALDEAGKKEESLAIYNIGIEKYPLNLNLLFNKAVVLEGMEEREKAIEAFKEALQVNPFHASSHIRMGINAVYEGNISEALMAFIAYLMIEPASGRTLNVLSYANNIASIGSDDIGKGDQNVMVNSLEELDFLVKNKIALNTKYKVPGKIDFAIVKQTHLMLEQLKNDEVEVGEGFWKNYYVPMFRWLADQDFEIVALLISYSSTNDDVKKLVSKKGDDLSGLRDAFLLKWKSLHDDQTMVFNGEPYQVQKWYGNNFLLQGHGAMDENELNQGPWRYFHPSGKVGSEGIYKDGERHGKWFYFSEKGDTTKWFTYDAGKLNGPYMLYHPGGELLEKGTYINDEVTGLVVGNYPSGKPKFELNFSNGKYDGLSTRFYESGGVESKSNYVEGKLDGTQLNYHPNGQVSVEITYEDGVRQGLAKAFYYDGTLKWERTFVDDIIEGPYKTYYPNGNLESEGQVSKDAVVGHWKYYYSNGKLREETHYSENGKISGEETMYDMDGKIYRKAVYDKGLMKSMTYLDANGSEYYSAKESRGKMDAFYFDHRGRKISEGTLVDGKRDGRWLFYNHAGKVDVEENYKNGEMEGESLVYFENGKISYKKSYSKGQGAGLYQSYQYYGPLFREGYLLDGEMEGVWTDYYPNGSIAELEWYEKGLIKGRAIDYSVTGKPYNVRVYNSDGNYIQAYRYDSSGVLIDSAAIENGTGTISIKGASGKKYFVGSYLGGKGHGEFQWLYPDGKTEVAGEYFEGQREGKWNWYHPNGQVDQVGLYQNGELEGTWQAFDYFGNPLFQKNYFRGQLEGKTTYFYPNGTKESELNYMEGKRHGPSYYYAPDGQVKVIRNYDQGALVSYTYYGDGNTLAPEVQVENESAHIVAYYPNGQKSVEYTFKDGWFQDNFMHYYPDGTLQEKAVYVDNQVEGEEWEYYPNGQKAKVQVYKNGDRHGPVTVWAEDGQKLWEGNYFFDKKHGPFHYYGSDGKKKQTLVYYNNEVVEMR